MSGNVIDFDPKQRLTKEAFESMKAFIAAKTIKDVDSLTIIYRDKSGGTNVLSYGLDFDVIGRASTMLNSLGEALLIEEFEGIGGQQED